MLSVCAFVPVSNFFLQLRKYRHPKMMHSIYFYFILIALPKNTFLFLTASENDKKVYTSLYLGLGKIQQKNISKRPNEQVITCR